MAGKKVETKIEGVEVWDGSTPESGADPVDFAPAVKQATYRKNGQDFTFDDSTKIGARRAAHLVKDGFSLVVDEASE